MVQRNKSKPQNVVLDNTVLDDVPLSQEAFETRNIEDSITKQLGMKVSIQNNGSRGKIIIHYSTIEELDGVITRLNKSNA